MMGLSGLDTGKEKLNNLFLQMFWKPDLEFIKATHFTLYTK